MYSDVVKHTVPRRFQVKTSLNQYWYHTMVQPPNLIGISGKLVFMTTYQRCAIITISFCGDT